MNTDELLTITPLERWLLSFMVCSALHRGESHRTTSMGEADTTTATRGAEEVIRDVDTDWHSSGDVARTSGGPNIRRAGGLVYGWPNIRVRNCGGGGGGGRRNHHSA